GPGPCVGIDPKIEHTVARDAVAQRFERAPRRLHGAPGGERAPFEPHRAVPFEVISLEAVDARSEQEAGLPDGTAVLGAPRCRDRPAKRFGRLATERLARLLQVRAE